MKLRFKSFRFAFRGILSLLRYEHNSRLHLLAAFVAITAGILLKISILEWCLVVFAIGLVFIAELFNTSLEKIADAVDPEWNDRIMKAKDFAAAAVLISAIISLITGGLIFIPKLLQLI